RSVGFGERKSFEECANGNFRGDAHELGGILPGEICDRAQDAFSPEKVIGELRNIAHVDPAANDNSSFANAPQSEWNYGSGRCEHNCGIKFVSGRILGSSGPYNAERPGEVLALPRTREYKNFTPFIDRDLCDEDCSGAESEYAEPACIARFLQ